jgi:site-specific recombinase XerD
MPDTTEPEAVPFDDDLIESWAIALHAERKARRTRETYTRNLRLYAAWCREHGQPVALSRHSLRSYLAGLDDAGLSDNTVASRHIAIRLFCTWLAEEEGTADVLYGIKGPKIDEKVVDPFTDEELAALLAACRGLGFADRRDEALVRVFIEAGPRAADILSMTVSGTNVAAGTAVLVGKGGGERVIAFGPQARRAIDRYLRMRRMHRLAGVSDRLWLGDRGKTFGYNGLYRTLAVRAQAAGIEGFHLHRLRHTFADRWLDKGGSEGGLMTVAGWQSRKMVDRYARRRQAVRAVSESHRLELGDL